MAAHEILPQKGTVYSLGPRNAGLPADLRNSGHYPVEARCKACGKRITLQRFFLADWRHEERAR